LTENILSKLGVSYHWLMYKNKPMNVPQRWFIIVAILNTNNVVCFLLGNSMASEFRRRGITPKKAYNIQNTAKVWNKKYKQICDQATKYFYPKRIKAVSLCRSQLAFIRPNYKNTKKVDFTLRFYEINI